MCGNALRVQAKFCDECGAATTVAADRAEYRQVTVLFADVVRSMDIAAAVEAERLRDIMTELVDRSAAVVRDYGGTPEFIGDGVMALFGAPIALEDHAFRGCLAALAIQEEADRLGADVLRRDGIELLVRVGLNSGRVIAGAFGSGQLGYRATGRPVGMAQRMESAAPPGAVMLSESTAALVEHKTVLTEPEWVHIKGADEPVPARRLVAINPRGLQRARTCPNLVGRRWEMAVLDAQLERSIDGRGGVVDVIGPPGIGKSRVAREVAIRAATHGVDVVWTFCESHARRIPFLVVARLLRAATGVADLDDEAARARLRTRLPDAEPHDLLLLDDLLGIADPDALVPDVEPDARRRRLIALLSAASLARANPVVYIFEDVHWIDEVSESILAEFLTVIPRTASMVVITARPDYRGALIQLRGAQTIALAPLGNSDTATLLGELLGSDPSVADLAAVIGVRAAGNPFFAEEMVRELVQRRALSGERGRYVCDADAAEVGVPATVQAAITARIDRLSTRSRRTLNAAAVIGANFGARMLTALGIDPMFDELLEVELIDQVRFSPDAEFVFHHALIRAVAYESQLIADRAEWHRCVARAIEREADSADENASQIADHLQAAGDLAAAYGWQMRAGAWAIKRDVGAARASWERARLIADQMSDARPEQLAMRIAPRTMLCATDFLAKSVRESWGRFDELRQLCAAAGDDVSLAVGMTGLASELLYAGRPFEGARLASEQMALLMSIGDPTLTAGLSFMAFANWFNSGEFDEIRRWSQIVIDLTAGDPTMGAGFGVGSPLAIATTFRGIARWWLGQPDWRRDLDDAVDIAKHSDPTTFALVTAWAYGLGIASGVLRADDSTVRTIEDAVQTAQLGSNDFALRGAQFTLATALLVGSSAINRPRGLELMASARDEWLPPQAPSLVPVAELWVARELARLGDADAAIPVIRTAADELHRERRHGWDVCAARGLVEALVERGTEDDLVEAQAVIDTLAELGSTKRWAIIDIALLHLRALLARSRHDDEGFHQFADRYRQMAEAFGFEGHIDWAELIRDDS